MSLDAAYRHALDEVPGIRSYRVVKEPPALQGQGFDGRLKLRTEAGNREFLLQIYRSHLTNKLAEHIIAVGKRVPEPLLILAPHIGAGLSAKLVAARLNYLDAQGNCHIAAPPLHIHVQGKTATVATAVQTDKGLRSAAYQVLFVYLAEPVSLDASLRAVAERAGVSRQPAFAMKHRLLDEGYVFEAKSNVRWHSERRRDALNLWLHGYETVVRPSLVRGMYRTQDASPGDLEQRIGRLFSEAKGPEFRWGGSAAGFRLTRHYRGQSTVIHVNTVPRDLHRQLRALRDPSGNLVLLDAFGSINWQAGGDTVHPLLVYSEMLHEGGERAREAARELYEKRLEPLWAQRT